MDITGHADVNSNKASAEDVLSLKIEGAKRPQLSLVDLSGLQASSRVPPKG
jgi:hypothetical protein